MSVAEFEAAKAWLAEHGLDVGAVRYDGAAFGSWAIEAKDGGSAFRVGWDGRDGWLVVQRRGGPGGGEWVEVSIEKAARGDAMGQSLARCLRGIDD